MKSNPSRFLLGVKGKSLSAARVVKHNDPCMFRLQRIDYKQYSIVRTSFGATAFRFCDLT